MWVCLKIPPCSPIFKGGTRSCFVAVERATRKSKAPLLGIGALECADLNQVVGLKYGRAFPDMNRESGL